MKQIIVTTVAHWIDGSGYDYNTVLDTEVVEVDTPLTCEDIGTPDLEFELGDGEDIKVGIHIYNSEEDFEEGKVFDEKEYWYKESIEGDE